ncbi:helix-hairpin-helix domain-containing protein [Gordonia sp. NPDC003424]
MGSSARHPRSALDRLGNLPDDPSADGSPAGESPGEEPPGDRSAVGDTAGADRADGGWGVAAVPTWLDSLAPEEHSGSSTTIGDRFGELLDDADDDHGRRRVAVAPPAAIALILIGVVACAVAGYSVLRSPSEPVPAVAFPASAGPIAPTTGAPPERGAAGAAASTSPSAELVVSVVGLVRRPGLVRLPPAARVADAIARAGGAREGADLLSLNMAQRVNDGDQILVGYAHGPGRMTLRSAVVAAGGEADGGRSPSTIPSAGAGPRAAATSAPGGKVDLNTATEAQLDALPGVGPVTAKAILAWRDRHGRFTSVDQLGEVDGIGPARLAKLRDLVTV